MTYKDVVDIMEFSNASDVSPYLQRGWLLEKIVQKMRRNHSYEEYGPCYILIKKKNNPPEAVIKRRGRPRVLLKEDKA